MAKKSKKTPVAVQTHKERLRQQQEAAQAKAARIRRSIIAGAIVLGAVVVTVFVLVFIQQSQLNAERDSVIPPDAATDSTAIRIAPDKVKADAPKVQLYFDYQCSTCKQLESIIGDKLFELANAGDIDLQMTAMTFLDTGKGTGTTSANTGASSRAAIAAACSDSAAGNEVYQKFHKKVFESQQSEADGFDDTLLRDTITTSLEVQAADQTEMARCYNEKLTQGFVTRVSENAFKAGVNATPAIAINGKVVDNQDMGGITADGLLDWIKSHA